MRAASLLLAGCLAELISGCGVDVRERRDRESVKVKVPFVRVDVQSDEVRAQDLRAVGLNPYPGAQRTEEDSGNDNASVMVQVPFYTMQIIAAGFETSDALEKVSAFYREELRKLGSVTESTEGPRTKMKNFRWKPGPNQRVLSVDTDNHIYMVAMKPKDKGCAFALIYMDFSGKRSAPRSNPPELPTPSFHLAVKARQNGHKSCVRRRIFTNLIHLSDNDVVL